MESVSLISVPGRFSGRVMKQSYLKLLEDSKMIMNKVAFKKEKSCMTNIVFFLGKVMSLVNKGNIFQIINLDLRKTAWFGLCDHHPNLFLKRKMLQEKFTGGWLEDTCTV